MSVLNRPWFHSQSGYWVSTVAGKRERLAFGNTPDAEARGAVKLAELLEAAERKRSGIWEVLQAYLDRGVPSLSPRTQYETRRHVIDFQVQCRDRQITTLRPFDLTVWLDEHPTWHANARGAAAKQAAHCQLLRDVFGNPWQPVSVVAEPAWPTPAAVSLAKAAYAERRMPSGELDRDRLAVLAGLLETAGCEDDALLEHLRSPGPHVRGCFAVDALLGRL